MYDNNNNFGCTGAFAIIIIIFLIISSIVYVHRSFDKAYDLTTVTYTVTDKGTKRKNDNEKYLVYCVDDNNTTQVLEITDSLWRGRFNSSDVYAGIEIGKRYKFVIGGHRSGYFSWYPNIYEYTEIESRSQ